MYVLVFVVIDLDVTKTETDREYSSVTCYFTSIYAFTTTFESNLYHFKVKVKFATPRERGCRCDFVILFVLCCLLLQHTRLHSKYIG